MTPTDEIQARLEELGIEYTFDDSDEYEIIEWQGPYNLWWQFVYDPYEEEPYGELRLLEAGGSTHLTPKQAIAATVGKDIEHYDGSGHRGTVAILQGGRKPEEVMFVGDEGGVTHYLPEDAGTCKIDFDYEASRQCQGPIYRCDSCGVLVKDIETSEGKFKHCPNCGAKVVAE